mgnify:CR=1 FL=1
MIASAKKIKDLNKKQTDDVLVKFAVSYTRVSTGKQTKEWKTGINRQEKAWLRWLEEHHEYTPWERKFVDLGVSGRGKNRTEGALFQFLEKARRDEFPPETCLVVESVSRFTRDNVFDGLKLCIEIFDLGHRLAFTQWGGEVLDKEGRGVWDDLVKALGAAQFEWDDKSARINEYNEDKLERIKNGNLCDFKPRTKDRKRVDYPFWLDLKEMEDRSKNYFVHNDQANHMVRMFNLALEVGNEEISKTLFAEGRPAINNPKRRLCRSTIGGYLKSRAVLGEWQPQSDGGKPRAPSVKGVWPPLIEPELWEAVQQKRKSRFRNQDYGVPPTPKIHNLFRGSIFCACCNSKLNPAQNRRLKKNGEYSDYQYLYCSSGFRGAVDICTINTRLTTKKAGVDGELAILERLQTFHWAELFSNKRHSAKLKTAKNKMMRLFDVVNKLDERRESNEKAEDEYINAGRAVPLRYEERFKNDQEEFEKALDEYKFAESQHRTEKQKETGFQAERKIKKRVKDFIKSGREDIAARKEFSRWFLEMGLAISVNLETGSFELGLGTVEKNRLIALDLTLEDAAVFIKDPKEFEEFKKTRKKQMVEEDKLRIELPRKKKKPRPTTPAKELITLEGPLLPPDWKGEPDNHQEYWFKTRMKNKSRKE